MDNDWKVELEQWAQQLESIDYHLIDLVLERSLTLQNIHRLKQHLGLPTDDPHYERQMLDTLASRASVIGGGGVDPALLSGVFKQIFSLIDGKSAAAKAGKPLLVSRKSKQDNTEISLKQTVIGGSTPVLIAGPCAVESYGQLRTVAAALKAAGIHVMRGGAFKPRTSPYDFQGLGVEGLHMLKEVADEFGLATVSEIVHPDHIDMAGQYIDVIQIGARNMQNFELLKAAGESNIPVLLKRGIAATMEEFILAAEYIVSRGNKQVMLIERGIRTYEKATRNTLDISAVPILKQETHLPVLVDVTHSTGRKDILVPCAKAALAAGADGVMVEVHPDPANALSDAAQQLNIEQFLEFYSQLRSSGLLPE